MLIKDRFPEPRMKSEPRMKTMNVLRRKTGSKRFIYMELSYEKCRNEYIITKTKFVLKTDFPKLGTPPKHGSHANAKAPRD